MILLPAIDIRGGQCVRLTRGEFDTAAKVAEDPVETGLWFRSCGAHWIHMVDLDGAVEGAPRNFEIFQAVARETGLPVEVGGGIRDLPTVERYLDAGISRVILGSAALKKPAFVREAVKLYGEKIAVGIDAKNGLVSINGWLETSDMDYLEFARMMEDLGVSNIIYTDIATDGTLEGPNLEHMRRLKETVSCKITASGGVRDLSHIRALAKLGLYGAICGKAVYSGTLDLREAVRAAGEEA